MGGRVKKLRLVSIATAAMALIATLLIQIPAEAANTFPGTNDLVNINTSGGGGGNGGGLGANAHGNGISSDGNLVLFTSSQTNIQSSDGSGRFALYLRNLTAGSNTRVDVSASGVGGNSNTSSSNNVMSETGRYVVFYSSSTNLIDGTATPAGRYYLKDTQSGVISVIANATLFPKQVSNDGRFIFFVSFNTGSVISGVRNGYYDLVMLDTTTSTWTLINAPQTGGIQSVHTFADFSNMSCDGSFIVFQSAATNLVASYSGSGQHVFLVDLRNGFKITDLNAGATTDSVNPVISCNGKIIAFGTKDRTFVSPTPSGLNSDSHVVEYNRITGVASYVDSNSSGTFGAGAYKPLSVSDSGDVLFNTTTTSGGITYTVLNLKHISDGSGTRENVEKYAGGYLTSIHNNGQGAFVSANSKYVVYDTRDAYDLGLTPTQSCNTNPSSAPDSCDVVRSKTGL